MPRQYINMTHLGGELSRITVDNINGDFIEVFFVRGGIDCDMVRLPPAIALRLAEALTDAARSTQKVPTASQQAEQGARCGCGGNDDMCPCQNVVPIR